MGWRAGGEDSRSCFTFECPLNIQAEVPSGLLELGRKVWARNKNWAIAYREHLKKPENWMILDISPFPEPKKGLGIGEPPRKACVELKGLILYNLACAFR